MNNTRLSLTILTLLCSFLLPLEITAQGTRPAKPEDSEKENVDGKVLEQEQIRPAFRAEPIVHRMEARRGQSIPFEFTLYSSGRPTRLLIKPIAITQRENGVISSDETVPAPDAIRIEGAEIIDMGSGDDHVIKGRVRVPITQSTFHSFGILVRDLGLETDTPKPAAGGELRFGIRYVTQYLLRCDIKVKGVRSEKIGDLVVESVNIEEDQGLAKLQAFITNPTDSPMSFRIRSQIRSVDSGTPNPPFFLAMPVRLHLSPPEKHEIRILAKTRLRLEEFVPHPLSSGDLEVEFMTFDGRRVGGVSTLTTNVDLLDFPAQNRNRIAISDGVTAEPAHVELSLQRGGKRISPLKFTNNSDQSVTLDFSAMDQNGNQSRFVGIRPNQLHLRPGSNRNALLMLTATSDLKENEYSQLKVTATRNGETLDSQQFVKIGIISRSEAQPQLSFGDMVWDNSGKTPALVLPVSNSGGKHLPLKATLTVSNVDGASVDLPAGYGRWLLPGQKDKFRFRFKDIPPPGQYNIHLVIDMGLGRTPIETTNSIEFTASTDEKPEEKPAKAPKE